MPDGSVTLDDLAPLAAFSVIGNETASSATPTAVKMMGIPGQTSTPTAGATTTLTNLSKGQQIFTGTLFQQVVLPVAATLPMLGFGYEVVNDSTEAINIVSSDTSLVVAIDSGARAFVFCKLLTGATAASWGFIYIPFRASAGDVNTGTNDTKFITPLALADSDYITNSAPGNTVMKSDGTNAVASQITDDGTNVGISPAGSVTIDAESGNVSITGIANVLVSGGGGGTSQLSLGDAADSVSVLGDAAGAGSNTKVAIDDSAQTIALTAANGVTVNGGLAQTTGDLSVTGVAIAEIDASTRIDLTAPVIKMLGLPTSDPHDEGQLYTVANALFVSAG